MNEDNRRAVCARSEDIPKATKVQMGVSWMEM